MLLGSCHSPSPVCLFLLSQPCDPRQQTLHRPPASPWTPPQTALDPKLLGDHATAGQEPLLSAPTRAARASRSRYWRWLSTKGRHRRSGPTGTTDLAPPAPGPPRPPPPPLAPPPHPGPLICCLRCQSSSARPALARPPCGEPFPRAIPVSRSASCAAAPGAGRRSLRTVLPPLWAAAAVTLQAGRCPRAGAAEGRASEGPASAQSFAGRLEAEPSAPAEARRAGPGSGAGQSGRGAGRDGATAAGGGCCRGRGLLWSPSRHLPWPGRPGQSLWVRPRSSCRACL